ncbi:MAG: helix-turn-helix domain-containing protein [Polyangia bacterium]
MLSPLTAKGPVTEQRLAERQEAARALAAPAPWILEVPGMVEAVELARLAARMPYCPVFMQAEVGSGMPELAKLIHELDPLTKGLSFKSIPGYSLSPTEMRGSRWEGTLLIEDLQGVRAEGQEWLNEAAAQRDTARKPLRLIATSRLGVSELLAQPHMSRELIHALDVCRLVVRPLRERQSDIIPLARRFLAHFAVCCGRAGLHFSREAETKLMLHPFPGNVRQLRSVVERAVALAPEDEVGASSIVFFAEDGATEGAANLPNLMPPAWSRRGRLLPSLAELERDYLLLLIRELGGRRSEMARVAGISYPTVRRKLAEYGLDVRAILQGCDEPAPAREAVELRAPEGERIWQSNPAGLAPKKLT